MPIVHFYFLFILLYCILNVIDCKFIVFHSNNRSLNGNIFKEFDIGNNLDKTFKKLLKNKLFI